MRFLLRHSAPSGHETGSMPGDYFATDHLRADLRGRTIRGGAVSMASVITTQFMGIGATIIMARMLTPNDNGLFAMVLVVTGFVKLFGDMGLSVVTIQRDQINQAETSFLFWVNAATGVILAILVSALAPVIAWFYGESELVGITIALSTGFVFAGLNVQHRALMKRQMQFTRVAVIDTLAAFINVVVGTVAAIMGLGYWALVLMTVTAAPIRTLAMWIACPWRPGRPKPVAGMREMVGVGGNLTGYKVLNYLLRNVDNFLIGRFYGASSLAVYSKAYTLLLLPLRLFDHPVAAVALPTLSRLVNQPRQYRQAFISITSNVCLITMPLVAFMVGTSDWLIPAVLGPQWSESSKIFAWLGISGLIEPFAFTTIWLFVSQGRSAQQFRWGLISSTLIVIGIVAGLPWGPVGVAIGYATVSVVVRMPLLFWYVGRDGAVRTRDLYYILAPFLAIVIITLAGIYAMRQSIAFSSPYIGMLAAATLTGVVTLAVLILSRPGRVVLSDLRSMVPALLRMRATV